MTTVKVKEARERKRVKKFAFHGSKKFLTFFCFGFDFDLLYHDSRFSVIEFLVFFGGEHAIL